jgi:hypothetical protein
MTHTPGPWTARESKLSRDGNLWFVEQQFIPGTIGRVAEVYRSDNARLIASAPDLLAACKLIASFAVAWQPLSVGDIQEVTKAIAKAEAQ